MSEADTVIVSQLGARMHYAVPRIFATEHRLARFYTDICAVKGWPRLLNQLPGRLFPAAIRRLIGRRPQGVPLEKITTFANFGLQSALRRLANETGPQSTANAIWAGEQFGRLVAARGFGNARGLYAFSSEALEQLQAAKQQGLWTAVEQMIAPRDLVEQLVQEEQLLHPDWQLPTANDIHARAFAEREKAEWQLADHIICPSRFVADNVVAAGGSADKIRLVPYGIDPATPPRARQSRSAGPLRVLTVGAVGLRKGSPYVVEAARILGDAAQFRMVGPIDVLPGVKEHISSLVELTGAIPRSEMQQQFAWADVFLLPSLCEGSATAVYEALASGLPVICTENTGSVVRDGIDGFVVPIRNVEAIVAALDQLAQDEGRYLQLSANAAQRAQDYTVQHYGQRLLAALMPDAFSAGAKEAA